MADFLHCNTCNAVPDQNSAHKFLVSTCGHLFCHRCRTAGEPCRLCNQQKVCKLLEIGKLDSNKRQMFLDPVSLAKQQATKLVEALSFQKSHRSRYLQFVQKQMKAARKMQEALANEAKKRQHLEKENQELKEQLAHAKRQMMRLSSARTPATPGMSGDASMRYRSSGLPDQTMTVSSLRTGVTAESGSSLPLGAEARIFNASRNSMPITPYLDSSMSSPNIGIPRFDGNYSGESVAGGHNSFNHLWANGDASTASQADGVSQNTARSGNMSFASSGMSALGRSFRRRL